MLTLVIVVILLAGGLSACVHSALYTSRIQTQHPADGLLTPVNGHDVHVVQMGDASGPPVLFIHGASANGSEFEWTLAPKLEDSHQLLIADRPGHGYSARPPNGQALGIQAAQMAGVLAAHAGDQPAVVVGHSFGGAVALRLALDHPEKVAGLVLLAPVSHDWGGGGQAWYNSWATMPLIGRAFSHLVPLVGPAQAKNGVVSTFHPAPVPDNYLDQSAIGLLFRPPTFRANARDVIALREELAAQQTRYGELSLPIIVFSGAQDTVISPPLHVGQLKHEVDDLELVKLPQGGHMPHHAHGDAVAEAIVRLASRGEAR